MKQTNLFGLPESDNESIYSSKIETPIYEVKGKKPHVLELYDNSKSNRLINEINQSDIPDDEKRFLIEAAKRHTVFNYENIANYYAQSSKEVQNLMERSALVIIDFEKAIQLGYVRLSDEIRKQYLEEYGDEE